MNKISFMSANYVARQVGYHMPNGWGQGDRATNEYFRPVEMFAERFDVILADIRALDFDAMDLWLAHLNPEWATDKHVAIARDLLNKHGLKVVSLAGGMGSTREQLESRCKLAVAIGTRVLGGGCPLVEKDRRAAVALLKEYDLKLGLENHPGDTDPDVMLAKIGDGGDGTIGATLDTGWFGTYSFDAPEAIRRMSEHLFHIHLKDVLHHGFPHDTCAYGQGVVDIEGSVRALQEIGYGGAISVEHEPEDHDPTEDIRSSYAMLREWLAATDE